MKIITDSGYDNTCYPNHWYGWFYYPSHLFFAIIELVIQFSNAFMQLFVTPVIPKYLFLTFRYDDHFLLQCLSNSTMDFKIIRLYTPPPKKKKKIKNKNKNK